MVAKMKVTLTIMGLLLCLGPGGLQTWAEGADAAVTTLVRMDQEFTQSAPYSDATNITKHLGYTVPLPAYTITNEMFQLRVPVAFGTNGAWGLLVWISPADNTTIPVDWDSELGKHHLLFISAYRSGNSRHPLDRFRLALDATCNMCRRYSVDRKRIYIGGFSGGARIASMLGVAYADIFTGTLCCCGVNFYTDVPTADGRYYPATFTPDPGVLLLGKRSGRFVLLSGEHDENRDNTDRIATRGFKREGFRNVLNLEMPGLGHEMPTTTALAAALGFLNSDKNTNLGSHN
jgi:predicted esterase